MLLTKCYRAKIQHARHVENNIIQLYSLELKKAMFKHI